MRRFIFLILVVLAIFAILLFVYNPDLLEKIWLWIVGLIGVIIASIKRLIEAIVDFFREDKKEEKKQSTPELVRPAIKEPSVSNPALTAHYEQKIASLEKKLALIEEERLAEAKEVPALGDSFKGTTLTVLRYFDDGETTLGLLFINAKFFCYTLEDTHRKVKVKGKTRIPKGVYTVDFNRNDTPLTLKYRSTRPWFHYHLHIKNVKGFENIYIHSGSTHEHTEGCLLVAKSIHSDSAKRTIFDSRVTFEELYKQLQIKLDGGERIRIKYYDEDFLSSFESLTKAS